MSDTAIVVATNGVTPLLSDSEDGLQFEVSNSPVSAPDAEYWLGEMEAHAHEIDDEVIDRLLENLAASKREQKELVSRKQGHTS